MIVAHASSLARIMACAGSIGLTRDAPPTEQSEPAAEGTAAAWVAEELFAGRWPVGNTGVGRKAPNGWTVDAEMIGHARDYTDTFNNTELERRVEKRLDWGDKGFEVKVKPDLVLWHEEQATLAVNDFKYGYRIVSPEENWQLLAGAIGGAMNLGVQPRKFILSIYQPRAFVAEGPLRTWEATPEQVLDAYHRICERLSNPDDSLATGDHCLYCPAAINCAAYQSAMYNAIDVALSGVQSAGLPNAVLRSQLELLERAEELIKQSRVLIESQAISLIKNGATVPGLITKPVLGHTTWTPDGLNKLRGMQTDNQRFFDEVVVTPAEARRRGLTDDDLKPLTHRPGRGVKLARTKATDEAEKVFK